MGDLGGKQSKEVFTPPGCSCNSKTSGEEGLREPSMLNMVKLGKFSQQGWGFGVSVRKSQRIPKFNLGIFEKIGGEGQSSESYKSSQKRYLLLSIPT